MEDKIERLDSEYLDSLPYGLRENILVGKGLEKLMEVIGELKRLEPVRISGDLNWVVYIEVPRRGYKRKKSWYKVYAQYNESGNRYWLMVDNMKGDFAFFSRPDGSLGSHLLNSDKECDTYWCDFFEMLKAKIGETIDWIERDFDGYCSYVDTHVPYEQRSGVISREDVNRILPEYRPNLSPEAVDALKVTEDNVQGYDKITLASFFRYFRCGHRIFTSGDERRYIPEDWPWDSLSDMEYVERATRKDFDGYGLDSEEEYKRFDKEFSGYHVYDIVYSCMWLSPRFVESRRQWVMYLGGASAYYNMKAAELAPLMAKEGCPVVVGRSDELLTAIEGRGKMSVNFGHVWRNVDDFPFPASYEFGKGKEYSIKQKKELFAAIEWDELTFCKPLINNK